MKYPESHIEDRIYRFGKRKRLFELLGSLSHALLLLLVLWLSVALADQIFYFSRFTRWGLLAINIPLLGYLLYRFVYLPWRKWLELKPDSDLTPAAALIGKTFPELRDSLINIYQLGKRRYSGHGSESLRQAAIHKLSEKAAGLDFFSRLQLKTWLPGWKMALPVMLSAFVLLGMRGSEMVRSTLRLMNPTSDYLIIPEFTFSVVPGSTDVIKNESLTVEADYTGPELDFCSLDLYRDGQYVRSIRMTANAGHFAATIPDIRELVAYRVQGHPLMDRQLSGLIYSDLYEVEVRIPPRLAQLDLRLTPPPYSGLEEVSLDRNVGDISALPGTRVNLSARADNRLSQARIEFESAPAETLQVRGTGITGSFMISKSANYKIRLIDMEGLSNRDPISYNINTIPDRAPFVEIVSPGQDVESPLDVQMQLQIRAGDDFGIAKMHLMYQYVRSRGDGDSTWHQANLNNMSSDPRQAEAYHLFDFDNMPIAFDDAIKYYAVALDNNTVSGPGKGRSAVYYIRFPSINEILDSFAEREAEQTEKLDEVVSESDNLKKELEELNRDLKREKNLDWETRQQIEESVQKQEKLREQLENVQKELEELVEKLDQSNLISEEVLEKYMQIQEMFREIATPELLEAMKKLQESLEQPNPGEVQKALERFKLNQEAFRQNVERTLELLKQVQLEQKVDQLVRQAEQLLEQQEKIGEGIEKKDPRQAGQLSDQQEQQKAVSDHMQQSLNDLLQEPRLEKFRDAARTLEQAEQEMQKSELSQQMENLASQLNNMDWQDARQQSEDLKKQLDNLRSQLSQAQQQIQNQHKTQVQQQMLSALEKVLDLSFTQEEVHDKTKSASRYSEEIQEMNKEQGELMENFQKLLSSLVKLSRETFFIDPQLNKALAKAQKNMTESLSHLGERRNAQAARNQAQAMQGLNEAAQGLQKSLSQLSASGSGTGFEQFMEQMQKMAGMQGQVNEGTMNLFQGQGQQRLTPGQQGEMRRLAAQQRAIQQAMQEMNDKMGNRDDILGRLGELGGEMEEVVDDLLNMNVDRKTIDRQRQILSRMLDAQKSVREREFSKKRKAERAKQYIARDPGDMQNPEDAELQAIQNALKQALREGYGPDYQKLIEAYFKSLTENSNR